MRRLLIAVVCFGIVTLGVLVLVQATLKKTGTHLTQTQSVPTGPRVTPSTPQVTQPPAKAKQPPAVSGTTTTTTTPNSSTYPAAVTAAAEDSVNLASALFYPSGQLDTLVRSIVAPEAVNSTAQTNAWFAPIQAQFLGYGKDSLAVQRAYQNSAYTLEVSKYRVVSLSHTKAVIELYTYNLYVTGAGRNYKVPALTFIQMEKVGSKWLFVSSADPPSSEAPRTESGLTLAQDEQRFAPYLKGFTDYAGGR